MFKNRSIQVKLVKTPQSVINEDSIPAAPVDYDAIAKEATKRLVIGTVIVISTTIVLRTLGQIAINALTPIEN